MKFEYYRNGPRDWRWRLVGRNGRVIASGEGYRTRRACEQGIELVRSTGVFTPMVEVGA